MMQLLILDFDGTLCDTHLAILRCIQETFIELNLKVPETIAIEQTIASGMTLLETFIYLAPESVADINDWASECVISYRKIYNTQSANYINLFPNVLDTLKYLHSQNIVLVVVSNKGELAINTALKLFNIKEYISLVVGDRPEINKKPAPDIYNEIIHPAFALITKQDTLIVGDTTTDILFANNLNISVCWVKYGYGNQNDCVKLKPQYTIDVFSELKILYDNIDTTPPQG